MQSDQVSEYYILHGAISTGRIRKVCVLDGYISVCPSTFTHIFKLVHHPRSPSSPRLSERHVILMTTFAAEQEETEPVDAHAAVFFTVSVGFSAFMSLSAQPRSQDLLTPGSCYAHITLDQSSLVIG